MSACTSKWHSSGRCCCKIVKLQASHIVGYYTMCWVTTLFPHPFHHHHISFLNTDHGGVTMEASVISLPLHSVLSNMHQCGSTKSCPLFNIFISGFSRPSSSLSTLNCFLDDCLGECVMMCYTYKPGKLSAFHNLQKWLFMACIWFYLTSNIDICISHSIFSEFSWSISI